MLLCTTNLLRSSTSVGWALLQATDTLPTGDHTTEKAEHRIANVLASIWAASLHRLFHQGVVVFWQTNEFEDSGVTERDFGRWIMGWCVGVHDPSLDESIDGRVILKPTRRLAHLVKSR